MKFTIAARIRLAFGAIAASCVVAIGAWLVGTRIAEEAEHQASAARTAQLEFERLLRGVAEAILSEGSSASRALTRRALEELDRTLPALARGNDALRAGHAAWEQLRPTVRSLLEQKSLSADDEKTMMVYGRLAGQLEEMNRHLVAGHDAAYAHSQRMEVLIARGGGAMLLLGMLVVAWFAWRLPGSITGPLRAASALADGIAQGDLSQVIAVAHDDEVGELLRTVQRMQASLERIVRQVRAGSDAIAADSVQIASGSGDLSQRTEQQAASLQQAAASMQQMSSTLQHNADTAQQATQLAGAASAVAAKGGEVVGQVVATMRDISASSKRIADIIGVIDSIAFQTNILALNAAVEAARAGEQGRGFAVVAAEVRSLAHRSAQAAKEIKALIGQSVDNVEVGSRLVGEAGTTMGDIVAQVRRVSDLINEIATATQEQTQGIGQVNQAVRELDDMTQRNAALVEQSSTAADALRLQASRLAETVGVFKLATP